jgi:RNA polymerase sigma factor (sigma-70 family)
MSEPPITRPSLLVRLRAPRDERAWEEFVAIYGPLVERLARRSGLQEADAQDLVQDVFRAVAGAIDRWNPDPKRGSFRGWLFRIARNLMLNPLAQRRRQPRGHGETALKPLLEAQPGPSADDTALFETEYRRQVFQWAVEQIKDEFQETTWQAFWRTAVEQAPAKNVAESLGMSVKAVYVARNRVMARLKRTVERVEEE